MSEASARFSLPFIMPGQAQKEMFHNEALARIDALLHLCVEGAAAGPPPAPAIGSCWIVKEDGIGEWAGRQGELAAWTSGGWRYFAPQPGTLAWNKALGVWVHWDGAAWGDGTIPASGISVEGVQVVGSRQPAIASPSNGTIIDAEARSAIDQIIVALRSHGLIE